MKRAYFIIVIWR